MAQDGMLSSIESLTLIDLLKQTKHDDVNYARATMIADAVMRICSDYERLRMHHPLMDLRDNHVDAYGEEGYKPTVDAIVRAEKVLAVLERMGVEGYEARSDAHGGAGFDFDSKECPRHAWIVCRNESVLEIDDGAEIDPGDNLVLLYPGTNEDIGFHRFDPSVEASARDAIAKVLAFVGESANG